MICPFCDGEMTKEVSRDENLTSATNELCSISIIFRCQKCGRHQMAIFEFESFYDEDENSVTEHEQRYDKIRKEVKQFANRMESVLQENDYKNHWSKCSYAHLLEQLKIEVAELDTGLECFVIGQAMPRDLSGASTREQYGEVEKEAVDVANFAMMIADNLRNLRENDEDYKYFSSRAIEKIRERVL